METRASIRRHPIHPMIVVFPIAFWIGSLICDVVYHAGAERVFWKDMAFYLMFGGLIGALVAAVPGFVDYLNLRDRMTKRVATFHMALNLLVVVLYGFNLGLRWNTVDQGGVFAVGLSGLSLVGLVVAGWLGGHLVYVHRVGVSERPQESDYRRVA